jgi:hypothetical protein
MENAKELVALINEVVILPAEIEKNKVIELNYFKENLEIFRVEKISEIWLKINSTSKENLRDNIYLGELLKQAKENFQSPENKQIRKNLNLKISMEYFYSQNFSFKESYCNRLIKGAENFLQYGQKKLDDYLNFGHIEQGKCISIDNFNLYCKPNNKKVKAVEAVEVEVEAVEVEVEAVEVEVEAVESVEAVDFGGVKLSLSKATKDDIEKAIEYLMNKIS